MWHQSIHKLQNIFVNKRLASTNINVMNIFDKNCKRLQQERAANNSDKDNYDYLKKEIGSRMSDRIYDVKRRFSQILDLGCGRGYVSQNIQEEDVDKLYLADFCKPWLDQIALPNLRKDQYETFLLTEENRFPFGDNSLDLVISNLSLHWINNLPGIFTEVQRCLKPDGVFLGSMFGGDTLFELRSSLQLAENEREGGLSPHISPFVMARDIGGLLTASGFTLLTIDTDEIKIGYPSMFELMFDLKGMAENNAIWKRRLHLNRETLFAAASIYKELYGLEEREGILATYQIFYMIGWKPDKSQPKPKERGSGQVSLKDIHKLDEVSKKKGKVKVTESEDQ